MVDLLVHSPQIWRNTCDLNLVCLSQLSSSVKVTPQIVFAAAV